MARLDVDGLSFTYPGAAEATLRDVQFSVASGGSLALLGSSGAGKTTLLNLLSGLLPCTQGRILFDGRDVSALGAGTRGVAQVFQFPVLYESLNVRDNIGFPLRTRGVGRLQRHHRAEALAALFDLSAVLAKRPAELSLFQKQLTGFAKALARDDLAMLLLDEPLTAVEPAMKWRLRRAVKRAQAELGVTMVYVTHDQTEALTFADEVSVLHGGGLLQTGTPAELYDRPAHAEVARFIGNPGMNLLDARVTAGRLRVAGQEVSAPAGQLEGIEDGELEIGFRPEWGQLFAAHEAPASSADSGASNQAQLLRLSATLLGQRLTGFSAGKSLGIARVGVGDSTAQVVCEIGPQHSQQLKLQLNRFQMFRNGWRIAGPADL